MNASGSKAALGLPIIDFISENNWREFKAVCSYGFSFARSA